MAVKTNTVKCVFNKQKLVLDIAASERPYSTNFTQVAAQQFDSTIEAVLRCTRNSNEPGRLYHATFSPQGRLIAAHTLN